jgi:xanthine dehydrogenase molybdenum-binding subunit
MIPFDFKYIIPENVDEAVRIWNEADSAGETPLYYSGGTEIISFCRDQKITPGILIDIKQIPECNVFTESDSFIYGSALPLNFIIENTVSACLKLTLKGIADHTIRNKLTIGGNIVGKLPYREAVLPFLIMDGSAEIASKTGIRKEKISDLFDKRLKLERGELLVNISINPELAEKKYFYKRKEKDGRIDYPLLTSCFNKVDGNIRMAISGACSYPLRDPDVEFILNDESHSINEKTVLAVEKIKNLFKTDIRASAQYRKHLLKLTIIDALNYLENDNENL